MKSVAVLLDGPNSLLVNQNWVEISLTKFHFKRNPTTEEEFKHSGCDVYLRHAKDSGETIYLSHNLVLQFHSKRLRDDFKVKKYNQTASDGRLIVDISTDIDNNILKDLLDYMYQGRLDIPADNTPEKEKVR